MRTIHFNSEEARSLAVRSIKDVVPGRLYIECHTRTDDRHDYSFPPFAHKSYVTGVNTGADNPEYANNSAEHTLFYLVRETPSAVRSNLPSVRFATDVGIEDVYGAYGNKWNYLLDVEALKEKGIDVSLDAEPGTDMSYRADPLDDYQVRSL